MKALGSYAGAFVLKYGTNFVDARIMGRVEDSISMTYQPTCTTATYNRYILSDELLIEIRDVLPLLKILGRSMK